MIFGQGQKLRGMRASVLLLLVLGVLSPAVRCEGEIAAIPAVAGSLALITFIITFCFGLSGASFKGGDLCDDHCCDEDENLTWVLICCACIGGPILVVFIIAGFFVFIVPAAIGYIFGAAMNIPFKDVCNCGEDIELTWTILLVLLFFLPLFPIALPVICCVVCVAATTEATDATDEVENGEGEDNVVTTTTTNQVVPVVSRTVVVQGPVPTTVPVQAAVRPTSGQYVTVQTPQGPQLMLVNSPMTAPQQQWQYVQQQTYQPLPPSTPVTFQPQQPQSPMMIMPQQQQQAQAMVVMPNGQLQPVAMVGQQGNIVSLTSTEMVEYQNSGGKQ